MENSFTRYSRRVTRFFQTPKGLLTLVFALLIAIAAPGQGGRHVAKVLGCAAFAAGVVDAIILRYRKGQWEYPSGAVLSATIVVMVLRAQEPWYVATITSLIAVFSKYVFRVGQANVFNPAALAMLASYYLFHAGESWWGAVTDVDGLPKLILILNSKAREELLKQLVMGESEVDGKRRELAALEQTLTDEEQRLKELNGQAARLEDLKKDHLVAEAVFTSAVARLDTNRADVFASYPLVQILADPDLPMSKSQPLFIYAAAGGLAGTLFASAAWTLAWMRQLFARKRRKNA